MQINSCKFKKEILYRVIFDSVTGEVALLAAFGGLKLSRHGTRQGVWVLEDSKKKNKEGTFEQPLKGDP